MFMQLVYFDFKLVEIYKFGDFGDFNSRVWLDQAH